MILSTAQHNKIDGRSAADPVRPRVITVVLNWCGEDDTRRCLESLERVTYRPFEVLLVDNGSPDGSGERLRRAFPEVPYLQTGANLGYAGGNNRGIEWALERGADAVLVLNNDTVVEAGAVERLVETWTGWEARIGCVVPKILTMDEPDRIWYAGGEFSPLLGLGTHDRPGELDHVDDDRPREVTFATGCCSLFPAEAMRAVGGFDEAFFAYVEDAELGLRLASAGYRLVYEPRARVLHDAPGVDAEPSPFQIVQRDRNRRRVMRLHFGWGRRLPFLARFYATRAAWLLRYASYADWPRVRAVVRGLWG